MATRAEVATRAGVSPAVVSYVMNGGPRPVAVETRKRVLAAIEQLGYRPNAVAQALRGSQTHSIGLLLPDRGNLFFAELTEAVEDAAFTAGYVLLVGSAMGSEERGASYVRTFVDRQVDGLLLISGPDAAELKLAGAAGIPMVLLDRLPDAGTASAVVVDNYAGAIMAVEHLLSHGHRKVACVAGPASVVGAAARRDGWADALRRAGLRPTSRLLVHEDFSLAGGFRAAGALFGSGAHPAAVFVNSDVQAIGFLHACSQLGLRVPDDVAIVCFDGTEAARFAVPSLTAVTQPLSLIAQEAVDLLVARIKNASLPSEHRTLPVTLRLGDSCGCPTRPATGP